MSEFPIVTLCGSTRFKQAYEDALKRETLAGRRVFTVGMFGHVDGLDMNGPVKAMLDRLHLAKIDASEEILVLDCKRGRCLSCGQEYDYPRDGTCCAPMCGGTVHARPYIGSSTANEIAYAESKGKRIRYLSKEKAGEERERIP